MSAMCPVGTEANAYPYGPATSITLRAARFRLTVLDASSSICCQAGPPIDFTRASGPLRGALIGALIFEGLAADEAEAIAKLRAGEGDRP